MREQIEYAFVKLFLWLAKRVPKALIYTIMRHLSTLFYCVDSKRRRLTMANLTLAFPQKTSQEIEVLSKKVYSELSITIAEILLMFCERFDFDVAIKNHDEARKKLQYLAQNSPNGIIVVTAHFSNWELAAHFLAKNGLPMLAIGREGNNKLIDKNITVPFRNKYGNRATTKGNAMLAMAKTLKKGEAVGLLIDQKAGHLNSVTVDFFGRPAETTTSVAMLKLKFDPLVVPIFIARGSDGLYEMSVNDSIEYVAQEIEDTEKKVEAMTLKYNQSIEGIIRKYPEQWFWMHNRWRL